MVVLEPGVVVVIRFPYSDLSASKSRPAVVLAPSGNAEWVMCQVTSNPYADSGAVPLTQRSFVSGGLNSPGYARPSKLFTASETIVTARVGVLRAESPRAIVEAIVSLLSRSLLP